MRTLTETGGARIGSANVTWPFAQLKVNSSRLELSASIIGDYVFSPNDIILLEPYYILPVLGQGIRIKHNVGKYYEKVIFWTFQDPARLIVKIWETGFLTPGSVPAPVESGDEVVLEKQSHGGFPIKTPAVISIVLLWNLLFFTDVISFLTSAKTRPILGYGALSALCMIIMLAAALLWSPGARKVILKPGANVGGIKRFLYFIVAIAFTIGFGVALSILS